MINELKGQKTYFFLSEAHVKRLDKVFGTQQRKRQVPRPYSFFFRGLFVALF